MHARGRLEPPQPEPPTACGPAWGSVVWAEGVAGMEYLQRICGPHHFSHMEERAPKVSRFIQAYLNKVCVSHAFREAYEPGHSAVTVCTQVATLLSELIFEQVSDYRIIPETASEFP